MRNENQNLRKQNDSLNEENQNLKKQNDSLNKENQKLGKENKNLKEKLADLNIIKNKVKKIEEKYKILIEGSMIDDLKSKLNIDVVETQNYGKLLDGEKLVTLNIISVDGVIHHSIICKNKTKFNDVESQLYEKFPQYRDSEKFFLFNGDVIDRSETLEGNEIHGYTIMLKKIEESTNIY